MDLIIGTFHVAFMSWLWKFSGSQDYFDYKKTLWIRKVLIPYIIFLVAGDFIVVALFSLISHFPVTPVDGMVFFTWVFVISIAYGVFAYLLFAGSLASFIAFFLTANYYFFGVKFYEYYMTRFDQNRWGLFQYFFGAWIGLLTFFRSYV